MKSRLTAGLVISLTCALAGCGVSTDVQNAPAPPSNGVSIAFQPAPPTSLLINSTASITAVVSNDPSNEGVDWNVTCPPPSSNCGTLAAPHTASGQAQTYTPPSAISSNLQTITISAFATADHSKNVLADLNINAFGSVLRGSYVLQTNGVDVNGDPYQRAGVIILDGNGNVTSGERTVNFVSPSTGTSSSVSDQVMGGTYYVGADGRGTIAIDTADTNVGQQGTCASGTGTIPCGIEAFSLVVLSSSEALITKADNPALSASGESSTGKMELQTSTAAPANGYAFVTSGMDTSFTAVAVGGILNITAPNAISGPGSVADLARDDGTGVITSPNSSVTGTVSTPDAFGAVQINLTTAFSAVQFSGFTIDTSHLALIETDESGGTGFALTTGMAIGQGSATGMFATPKSFSGAFAFGMFGSDSTAINSYLTSAGIFRASAGALSGYIDEFQYQGDGYQGGFGGLQLSDRFHASYTLDASGTGRVDTNSSFTFSAAANGTGPELVFYLTGNGGPALVIDADIEPALGGAGVATGVAYPATAGANISGSYGLRYKQFNSQEVDSTGEVNATGGTISGVLDMNIGFSPQLGQSLTDGFQGSAIPGRFVGTWTDSFFATTYAVAYYPIDSGHGVFTEIDGGINEVNPGLLMLGWYAARTPVCQGCP